jgi:hypothetical protein
MSKLEGTREWLLPSAVVLVSVVLAVVTVIVGTQPEPNKFATSLLQGMVIVLSTWGAFVFGKVAARKAAADVVRPHARSGFRRVRNLYAALGRQRNAVADQLVRLDSVRDPDHPELVRFDHVQASLVALGYMVTEQIGTVDDALEDWRDLVPDEVAAIEQAGLRREEADG